MEVKKNIRTLTEEELKTVSGGYDQTECLHRCLSQGLRPSEEDGECKCVAQEGVIK